MSYQFPSKFDNQSTSPTLPNFPANQYPMNNYNQVPSLPVLNSVMNTKGYNPMQYGNVPQQGSFVDQLIKQGQDAINGFIGNPQVKDWLNLNFGNNSPSPNTKPLNYKQGMPNVPNNMMTPNSKYNQSVKSMPSQQQESFVDQLQKQGQNFINQFLENPQVKSLIDSTFGTSKPSQLNQMNYANKPMQGGNSDQYYYDKYMKYKTKYLNLVKQKNY